MHILWDIIYETERLHKDKGFLDAKALFVFHIDHKKGKQQV